MESEIQGVARRVAAEAMRLWGNDELFAKKLEDGDPAALEQFRPLMENAEKAWGHEYKVFALRHDGILWSLTPTLIEDEEDGQLVKFEWGWNAGHPEEGPCPSVTTDGGAAFDLAMELLEMFTDENGDPIRPERPEREEYKQPPKVEKFLDNFHKLADEFMNMMGDRSGCSLVEVSAWARAGKPDKITPHDYVDHPEDQVKVCSVCGHWYSTDPDHDDWGDRVCSLHPLMGENDQSIHNSDPRRTPELREAQRLDKLTFYMSKAGAQPAELDPMLDKLNTAVTSMGMEDRARYDKERVGR